MRILVVSTVYNTTPPVGYGGIERVVHYLTEALVAAGHDVVLMAPPRSWCSGRTVHVTAYDPDQAWRAVKGERDLRSEEPLYDAMRAFLEQERVDVIHDWSFQNLFVRRHPEHAPYLISTCIPPAPDYARRNLVACSAAHAALTGPDTRHVHYGLPLHRWPFKLEKTRPPVHIARIARFKAQHVAILAALKARTALVIAGNVENRRYFDFVVRPLLAIAPGVRYVGELNGTAEHLCDAAALVQTPRWFDCFPLVILEALASATPVIALKAGGVPEQIVHGQTGFLCEGIGDLADAMEAIQQISPEACRADAEARFSDHVMAANYVALYEEVIQGGGWEGRNRADT